MDCARRKRLLGRVKNANRAHMGIVISMKKHAISIPSRQEMPYTEIAILSAIFG
jgi:hypothetical protein